MNIKCPESFGRQLLHNLQHAVGNDGIKDGGWRNSFCVEVGSRNDEMCQILCGLELMQEGPLINDAQDRYYSCTYLGAALGRNTTNVYKAKTLTTGSAKSTDD